MAAAGPLSGGSDADDSANLADSDDPAVGALADARSIARRIGGQRRAPSRRPGGARRGGQQDGRTAGGYSAPGPDPDRDPQRLGPLLAGYVSELGWDRPLAEARVFADWAQLVGPDVASHCAPHALTAGELHVVAESTAWATQLRLLGATLLARLVAELGPHVVTRIRVTGPTGPSWKHGRWSVPGARGPRDTYG